MISIYSFVRLGIAAFGNSNVALVPAIALMLVIGTLSGYCFSLIGRSCAYTQATSYRQAWERGVSPKTAWMPAAACFLVTSCAVLAYSMILSDTLPALASAFLGYDSLTRTQALLGVTVVALLPLCLMKSLKSLAPFSLVGIMGMIYTSCAMAYRWWDQSYSVMGDFVETLAPELAPAFGAPETLSGVFTNPNIFILVSMLSTAFMAHYNAPKFYWELENNTLERYQFVVTASFGIALLMFIAVASFGFATFGTSCAGLVLNNYSTNDKIMSMSRIAVALSILFSYPLAFVGVRDGMLDLLQVQDRPDSLLNTVTVALLTLITGLAYKLTDLRKLLAFNGATWGNAVIYLMPTYMFVQIANKMKPELKKEVPLVVLTGILGLGMGIIGTVKALSS
jgi:amino acid permease